jgi:hypothetical protein
MVGSMMSGGAFLLINQQLSYRERLTYKWPLAQYLEEKSREKWKEFASAFNGERKQLRRQLGVDEGTVSTTSLRKRWNQAILDAQQYFSQDD